MKKRRNKTALQQCKYYEVDNIYEYMVEIYINGNKSQFQEQYKELSREARKEFVAYVFVEIIPTLRVEILQATI